MSSAVLLRKNLLAILQEKILPEIYRQGTPRIVLAKLPLRVPSSVRVCEMKQPPLREADAVRRYPEDNQWQDVQMHASRFPALFYVAEGEVDLLMGVTNTMRNQLSAPDKRQYSKGGYIFSLPAKSFFLVPSGIPQKGNIKPWKRKVPHVGRACLFHIRILPVGALCNYSTMLNGEYKIEYSLLIEDVQLMSILNVLIDELSGNLVDTNIVNAQLLTLMLRLQRGMTVQLPAMTDGLYSLFPDSVPRDSQAHILYDRRIQLAHEYIRLRIHEPLTPALIAAQLNVTPVQLNRLFQANAGLSTMSYVLKLRMDSARLLLYSSELSVQEISELVGFRQLPYFSRMFHRHVGCTPLQFRQRQRASQSTF